MGNLVEDWYVAEHKIDAARRQVPVKAKDMATSHGIDLSRDRDLDVLQDGTIVEIKSGTKEVKTTDTDAQFDALVKLIKRKDSEQITIKDRNDNEVTLNKLRYVFTDHEGAKASIKLMRAGFGELGAKFEVEVWSKSGQKKIVKSETELDDLKSWLDT
jgi:hypothetical protein